MLIPHFVGRKFPILQTDPGYTDHRLGPVTHPPVRGRRGRCWKGRARIQLASCKLMIWMLGYVEIMLICLRYFGFDTYNLYNSWLIYGTRSIAIKCHVWGDEHPQNPAILMWTTRVHGVEALTHPKMSLCLGYFGLWSTMNQGITGVCDLIAKKSQHRDHMD